MVVVTRASAGQVSILSEAETAAALLERIEPAQLPAFLDGQLPDDQLLVARAETVPVGGWKLDDD